MNTLQNQSDAAPATSKPSEFWTVFLLGIFLGIFGAHRFYARKFKSGAFQLLTCGGLGIWSFIDVIVILLSKFRNSTGVIYQNPKPKVAWGIFVAVCILGFISAASDKQSANGGSGSGSSSGSSQISESDVVGRWVGQYEGLTSMDITLMSGGSFISSAGDFAGGRHSSGNWHISGHNTVVIDYGDGGQNLLFSYRNGQLVAGNGRALNRQ